MYNSHFVRENGHINQFITAYIEEEGFWTEIQTEAVCDLM